MTAVEPGSTPAPLADGFVFAEGPRWRAGLLWFSDMHGEAVYAVTVDGEIAVKHDLPGVKPSGLGFLPSGEALVVSMADRAILRLAPDGSRDVHARLATLVADELNDMVVTPDGTAFVGSYSLEPGTGVLVRVAADGTAEVAADGMSFPNGTVISPDERTLTVAESKARCLTAFDLDEAKNLSNRRVVATSPDAAPDGIALDAEGAIWAAFPLAHEFRRYLPDGTVSDRVPAPGGKMAIACALGGPGRGTLFLLSAADWNSGALGGARTSTVDTLPVRVPGAGHP